MALTGQAAQLGEALFKLLIDNTGFTKGLSEAEKEARERSERIGNVLKDVGRFSAIGFGIGAAVIGGFSKDAAEAEGVITRLRATLRGLGPEFEAQLPAIEEWAAHLMALSDFDDEDILGGFRDMVQLTGSVTDAMLAMEAATNLANQSGEALATTSNAVLQGFNGQERGLRRMGVALSDGAKGHQALLEIMAQVDGANERTANSTERAYRRMQVEWGNARESLGAAFLPVVQQLVSTLGRAAEWVNHLSDSQRQAYASAIIWGTGILGVISVLTNAGAVVLQLVTNIKLLTAAQAGANTGTSSFLGLLGRIPPQVAIVIAALAALTAAFLDLRKAQESVSNAARPQSGGQNSSLIASERDVNGNIIYKTPQEISEDTNGFEGEGLPFVAGLVGFLTGQNARIHRAGESAESAARALEDLNEKKRKFYSRPPQAPGTAVAPWDAGYTPPGQNVADMIRQQGAYSY